MAGSRTAHAGNHELHQSLSSAWQQYERGKSSKDTHLKHLLALGLPDPSSKLFKDIFGVGIRLTTACCKKFRQEVETRLDGELFSPHTCMALLTFLLCQDGQGTMVLQALKLLSSEQHLCREMASKNMASLCTLVLLTISKTPKEIAVNFESSTFSDPVQSLLEDGQILCDILHNLCGFDSSIQSLVQKNILESLWESLVLCNPTTIGCSSCLSQALASVAQSPCLDRGAIVYMAEKNMVAMMLSFVLGTTANWDHSLNVATSLVSVLKATADRGEHLLRTFHHHRGISVLKGFVLSYEADSSEEMDKDIMRGMVSMMGELCFCESTVLELPAKYAGVLNSRSQLDNRIRSKDGFLALCGLALECKQAFTQQVCMDRIFSIVASNSANYLCTVSTLIFQVFVERMESFELESQESVIRILEYVIMVIDILPEAEMHALFRLLEGNIPDSLASVIFKFVVKLLNFNSRYKSTFNQFGLVKILLDLITKSASFVIAGEEGASSKAHESMTLRMLEVLTSLMEDSADVATSFRQEMGTSLVISLLDAAPLRQSALQVLRVLLRDSREDLGDMGQVVECLQIHHDLKVKKQLFWCLRRVFKESSRMQDYFRENEGFTAALSSIMSLSYMLAGSDAEVMEMFTECVHCVGAALAGHIRNQSFFFESSESAFADAVVCSGVLKSSRRDDAIQALLDMLLDRDPNTPNTIEHAGFLLVDGAEMHNESTLRLFLKIVEQLDESLLHRLVSVFLYLVRRRSWNATMLSRVGTIEFLVHIFEDAFREGDHPCVPDVLALIEHVGGKGLTIRGFRKYLALLKESPNTSNTALSFNLLKTLVAIGNNDGASYVALDSSDDWLHIPEISNKNWLPTNGLTFSCWINYSHTSNQDSWQNLDRLDIEALSMGGSPSLENDFPRVVLIRVTSLDGKSFLEVTMSPNGEIEVRPNVRNSQHIFQGLPLSEKRWHHIVIVYHRKRIQSSEVVLFLDGQRHGQPGKIPFPGSCSSFLSAYIGLRKSVGRSRMDVSCKFGPVYLLEDCLSAANIASIYAAGPQYSGYLQGRLFETPHLYDPIIPSGVLRHMEHLPLDFQLMEKARTFEDIVSMSPCLVPANKMYLAICAQNVDSRHIGEEAQQFLIHMGDPSSETLAVLEGKAYVCQPSTNSSLCRTTHGIVLGLAFVERASSRKFLDIALDYVLSLLQDSHRNVHFMNDIRGFEILGNLLRKRNFLFRSSTQSKLFKMCLGQSCGQKKLLCNMYAFKHLILDHTVWRNTSQEWQCNLYKRMEKMLTNSCFATINAFRLKKLKLVEHLLRTLSGNTSIMLAIQVVRVLEALFARDLCNEDMLSVLEFLQTTLTLFPETDDSLEREQTLPPTNSVSELDSDSSSLLSRTGSSYFIRRLELASSGGDLLRSTLQTGHRVRNLVLRLLLRMIHGPQGRHVLQTLIKTSSSEWYCYFFDARLHPVTVSLSLRLFVELYLYRPQFFNSFKNIGGFEFLADYLKKFSNQDEIYHSLFCLLLGVSTRSPFAEQPIQVDTLQLEFSDFIGEKVRCPQAWKLCWELLRFRCSHLPSSMRFSSLSTRDYFTRLEEEAVPVTTLTPTRTAVSKRWALVRNVFRALSALRAAAVRRAARNEAQVRALSLSSVDDPWASVDEDEQSEQSFSIGPSENKASEDDPTDPSRLNVTIIFFMSWLQQENESAGEIFRKPSSIELMVETLFGRENLTLPSGAEESFFPTVAEPSALSRSSSSRTAPPLSPDSTETTVVVSPSASSLETNEDMGASLRYQEILSPAAQSHTGNSNRMGGTPSSVSSSYSFTAEDSKPPSEAPVPPLVSAVSTSSLSGMPTTVEGYLGTMQQDPGPMDDTVFLSNPIVPAPSIHSFVFHDFFRSETAENLLALLEDLLVSSLSKLSSGMDIFLAVLQGIPGDSFGKADLIMSYQSKLIRHLMYHFKDEITTVSLRENSRLAVNIGRFCVSVVDRKLARWFLEGNRICLDLITHLISVFEALLQTTSSAKRSFSTLTGNKNLLTLQQLYRSLNRLFMLWLSPEQTSRSDVKVTRGVLGRIKEFAHIILSPRNQDDGFFATLVTDLFRMLKPSVPEEYSLEEDVAEVLRIVLEAKSQLLTELLALSPKEMEVHQLHRSIMSGGLDLLIRGPEVFWLWAPAHWDSIRLTFELTILPRAVAQRQQERELMVSFNGKMQQAQNARRKHSMQAERSRILADIVTFTRNKDKGLKEQLDLELERQKRARVDNRDRYRFAWEEWKSRKKVLFQEKGNWERLDPNKKLYWKLDSTEGPSRVRKKTELVPIESLLTQRELDALEKEAGSEASLDGDVEDVDVEEESVLSSDGEGGDVREGAPKAQPLRSNSGVDIGSGTGTVLLTGSDRLMHGRSLSRSRLDLDMDPSEPELFDTSSPYIGPADAPFPVSPGEFGQHSEWARRASIPMLLESGFDFTLSSPNGTERDASAAMEKEEDQTSGHFFSEFPVDEDSGSCSSSSTSRDSHPATSSSVDSGSQQQHHDHVEDLPSPQVGISAWRKNPQFMSPSFALDVQKLPVFYPHISKTPQHRHPAHVQRQRLHCRVLSLGEDSISSSDAKGGTLSSNSSKDDLELLMMSGAPVITTSAASSSVSSSVSSTSALPGPAPGSEGGKMSQDSLFSPPSGSSPRASRIRGSRRSMSFDEDFVQQVSGSGSPLPPPSRRESEEAGHLSDTTKETGAVSPEKSRAPEELAVPATTSLEVPPLSFSSMDSSASVLSMGSRKRSSKSRVAFAGEPSATAAASTPVAAPLGGEDTPLSSFTPQRSPRGGDLGDLPAVDGRRISLGPGSPLQPRMTPKKAGERRRSLGQPGAGAKRKVSLDPHLLSDLSPFSTMLEEEDAAKDESSAFGALSYVDSETFETSSSTTDPDGGAPDRRQGANSHAEDADASDSRDGVQGESSTAGLERKPSGRRKRRSSVSVGVDPAEDMSDAADDLSDESDEEDYGQKQLERLLDVEDRGHDRETVNGQAKEIYNCARVQGHDMVEGVFLLCRHHVYMVENYFVNPNGDIVEVQDQEEEEEKPWDQAITDAAFAPESIAVSATIREREGIKNTSGKRKAVSHHVYKFAWDEIRELYKRRYLLRKTAIEIFITDGRNYLLLFHITERNAVLESLLSRELKNLNFGMFMSETSKLSGSRGSIGRQLKMWRKQMTERWQKGEISNFEYLMFLNTMAGRTYNDLTQYPVFPWILKDYESDELDLRDPSIFRDLSKPMGALDPDRAKAYLERYDMWEDESVPKWHYGSHYSLSGVVLHYLVRMEPFSTMAKQFQGGRFDHPDRLFHSVRDAWLSASKLTMTDVKELIPEFFFLPNFLDNVNGYEFGKKSTGQAVDSVVLPPWAHNDPHEFILKHRQALESEHVSNNLHHWIDLIFGYKQNGPEAVEAQNVFYYLTYENAVNIDDIQDPRDKQAIVAQINNFGQTPKKLFDKAHPVRHVQPKQPPLNIYSWPEVISSAPVRLSSSLAPEAIYYCAFHGSSEKIACQPGNRILIPPKHNKYIAFGFPDNSLRMVRVATQKAVEVLEFAHEGQIICAALSKDGRTLVTGGEDCVVSVWRVSKDAPAGKKIRFIGSLFGHSARVTCVAICTSFSIILSGSEDRTCFVWDLNTMQFVRQLGRAASAQTLMLTTRRRSRSNSRISSPNLFGPGAQLPLELHIPATTSRSLHGLEHEYPVSCVYIDELSGEMISCSGGTINIWSINGDLMVKKTFSLQMREHITSVTSSHGPVWDEMNVIITGHVDGSVRFWTKQLKKSVLARRSSLSSREESRGESPMIGEEEAPRSASEPVALGDGELQGLEDLPLEQTTMLPPEEQQQSHGTHRPAIIRPCCRKLALRCKKTEPHTAPVTCLQVSDSNDRLVTGDLSGSLSLWTIPESGSKDFWIADRDASACAACGDRFSIATRRHHCRNCGRVLCSKCLKFEHAIPDIGFFNPVKVCANCFELLSSSNFQQQIASQSKTR